MPEQLEQPHPEIEQLGKEVGQRVEGGESKPEVHKEVVRESIGQKIYPTPQQQPSSAKATEGKQAQSRNSSSSVVPDYMKDAPREAKAKVESLLRLAYRKGIMYAIKEGQKGDAFTLDAFHDALTDKLYEEFKRRGILK